jgi:hypothetical protein
MLKHMCFHIFSENDVSNPQLAPPPYKPRPAPPPYEIPYRKLVEEKLQKRYLQVYQTVSDEIIQLSNIEARIVAGSSQLAKVFENIDREIVTFLFLLLLILCSWSHIKN